MHNGANPDSEVLISLLLYKELHQSNHRHKMLAEKMGILYLLLGLQAKLDQELWGVLSSLLDMKSKDSELIDWSTVAKML